MNQKYYKVTVYSQFTGEVFEITRYDKSPASALGRVLGKIKRWMTPDEIDNAKFKCEVEEIAE